MQKHTTFGDKSLTISTNHLRAHKDVLKHLDEAITLAKGVGISEKGTTVLTVDMGRIVGRSGLVKVNSDDEIRFLVRPGRIHPSKFVCNRIGDETRNITMVFRNTPKRVILVTAWIGVQACREPNDTTFENETLRNEAIRFWEEHALVM